MVMTERSTAVGVFTDRTQAERAIEELHRAGFNDDQIGFVTRTNDRTTDSTVTGEPRAETVTGVATGAVSGGVIGGVVGAAISLLIPGLGPALAGGILAATLGGAVLGAAAGGLVGALATMGVPEEEARYYEGELGAGRMIVTVNAPGRYQDAVAVLRANGAYDASVYYGQKASTAADAWDNAAQGATIAPTYREQLPRGDVPPGPGSSTHEYPQEPRGYTPDVPPGPGGVEREYPQGQLAYPIHRPSHSDESPGGDNIPSGTDR